jgi:hypothetical protein
MTTGVAERPRGNKRANRKETLEQVRLLKPAARWVPEMLLLAAARRGLGYEPFSMRRKVHVHQSSPDEIQLAVNSGFVAKPCVWVVSADRSWRISRGVNTQTVYPRRPVRYCSLYELRSAKRLLSHGASGAVPVNQGRLQRLFHSRRPDRLRSGMRLFQLCRCDCAMEGWLVGSTGFLHNLPFWRGMRGDA